MSRITAGFASLLNHRWSNMNICQPSPMDWSPLSCIANKKFGSICGKKVTFNLSANTTHVYLGYDPDDPLRPQRYHRTRRTKTVRAEVKRCLDDLEQAMEVD